MNSSVILLWISFVKRAREILIYRHDPRFSDRQVWANSVDPDQISRLMTKPTKWHVRPAKTQISLGIRPDWSESSLSTQWVAKEQSFLHADSEDWSDWADAQADPSLRWAHVVGICYEAAQMTIFSVIILA